MENDAQDTVETAGNELSGDVVDVTDLELNVTTVTTTDDELSEEMLRDVSGGRSY